MYSFKNSKIMRVFVLKVALFLCVMLAGTSFMFGVMFGIAGDATSYQFISIGAFILFMLIGGKVLKCKEEAESCSIC